MTIRRLITKAAVAGMLGAAALLAAGAPAMASAGSGAVSLSATGSGENEVPAGSGEAGATVTGSFQLTPAGALTYTVRVAGNGEQVAAGHIHRGATGVNGDVVVPLDASAINAGASATTQLDAALAAEIIANPGDFYLNVHSASFSGGLARGQLVTGAGAAPGSIDTGTGGQAADGAAGQAEWLIGGAIAVAAAGALVVGLRRRFFATS